MGHEVVGLAPWFVDNVHTLNSESDLPPDPTLSTSLKSVRIIAFAFFLDSGVSEAEYRKSINF
jgi:hypothetical protein